MTRTPRHPDADAFVVSDDGTAAGVVLQAGAALADPVRVGEDADARVVFVVPDGYQVKTVDVEPDHLQAFPREAAGTRHVIDVVSFLDLLSKHATPETEVYADPKAGRMVAVLDGGDPSSNAGGAGIGSWFENRVELTAARTPEWQAWRAVDGELLDQSTFAEWLEQHAHVVTHPSYADLIEVAQSIEVHQGGRFKSVQRTSSGARTFVVDEQHRAEAGDDGTLEVPTELQARLAPWEGVDPVDVRVLFRYRLTQGALRLGVRLIRADDVERVAWDQLVSRVRSWVDGVEHLTGLRVVLGTPPEHRRRR